MDANTPILGRLVSIVVHLADGREISPTLLSITPWSSRVEKEDQYPNEVDDWADFLVQKQMPGFDFDAFYSWNPTTLEECLSPPCCYTVTPEPIDVDVIVDGQIIRAVVAPEEKENKNTKSDSKQTGGKRRKRQTRKQQKEKQKQKQKQQNQEKGKEKEDESDGEKKLTASAAKESKNSKKRRLRATSVPAARQSTAHERRSQRGSARSVSK
jgi:hypothetical protein